MRRKARAGLMICIALASGLIGASCAPVEPSSPLDNSASSTVTDDAVPDPIERVTLRVVPGEFLVRFRTGVSKASAEAVMRKASMRPVRTFPSVPGLHLVASAPTQDVAMLKQTLAAADVEYIEPNFIYRAHRVPNDPDYAPRLWALNNTGQTGGGSSPYFPDLQAEEAWEITTGADDLVVAVIDSGVDYGHEDLQANIFRNESECDGDGIDDDANGHVDDCHGIDTSAGDADPMDGEEHGTHVAGTIGAVGNNGIGVTGVAWRVKVLPCRFLNSEGHGTTSGAIGCLDYIAAMKDRGVNVVATNNSWGNFENSRALADAIRSQRQRGILFVAAAGNDHHDVDVMPEFPCAYDLSNVICVAATYESIELFSNYGRGTVHLGAPGVSIYSTTPGNRYGSKDGTSMAAPHVSGALVLLQQQDRSRDWRALRNLLLAGAVAPREWSIPSVTGGRLDLLRSMSCTDSVVLARLRPAVFEEIHRPIGGRVQIRAQHNRCAAPNGNVSVTVAPSGELVTLRDDGAGEDDIAGDGVYSGNWTAQVAGTFTFAFPAAEPETFSVQVDEQLEPGFPLSTDTRTFEDGPLLRAIGDVAVGNIDADPQVEIVSLVPSYGPLHAWNSDGTGVPGWPDYHPGQVGGMSLGELDGDSEQLDIAAHYMFSGVRALRGDGTMLGTSPFSLSLAPAPVLADLDADGVDEIVGDPARQVDGTVFRAGVPVLPQAGEGVTLGLAAADLDADGVIDFVATASRNSSGTLWISNAEGRRDGFPVDLPGGANTIAFDYPLIGDIDADGAPEVLVHSLAYTGPFNPGQVQVFDARGRLERTLGANEHGAGLPALGDIDADGIPEIVMASRERMFIWNGAGQLLPGWPVMASVGAFATEHIAIGDVDGDGRVDVVVGGFVETPETRLALHAFRHDGTPIPGFPKRVPTDFGAVHPVSIADIDLDGRNEIVFAVAAGLGLRQTVFVYDLQGVGPYGPVEWHQKLGGPRRTGYYQTGKNLPNHAYLAAQVFGAGTIDSGDDRIACGDNCLHRYSKGANVQLTAQPRVGGQFARWRGACAGQGNPCTLRIDSFTETSADFTSALTVSLTGSGTGTVTSDLPGISCGSDCSESFAARSSVLLTATAPESNAFAGWSGGCSGAQSTCRVFIDDAKQVTANFTNRHALTVDLLGEGSAIVTSNPPGMVCSGDCTGEFPPGSSVDVTITPAADSYLESVIYPFCGGLQMPCRVTMNGPQVVQVDVRLKPILSGTVVGSGRITSQPAGLDCTANCSQRMAPTLISLTATPAAGWHFVRWEGACSNTSAICGIFMNGDRNVSAVFEQDPLLTVDFQGDGTGSVQSPAGLVCTADCATRLTIPQLLTLTASPGVNSQFSGWSGACSGTSLTCQITFDRAASVGVTFSRTTPPTSSSSSSGSGGASGGGGRYSWAELAALAAIMWLLMRLRVSRRAGRANPSASRTRLVSPRPCGSNPPAARRISPVDRSPARR